MSCANNVLPVYMWPSPGKIPEALCLPPVQVDTVHFSSEATETNGFSRLSSSLNRTAVTRGHNSKRPNRLRLVFHLLLRQVCVAGHWRRSRSERHDAFEP